MNKSMNFFQLKTQFQKPKNKTKNMESNTKYVLNIFFTNNIKSSNRPSHSSKSSSSSHPLTSYLLHQQYHPSPFPFHTDNTTHQAISLTQNPPPTATQSDLQREEKKRKEKSKLSSDLGSKRRWLRCFEKLRNVGGELMTRWWGAVVVDGCNGLLFGGDGGVVVVVALVEEGLGNENDLWLWCIESFLQIRDFKGKRKGKVI